MRRRTHRTAALFVVATTGALCLVAAPTPVAAGPVPQPLTVTVSGTNGVNRIQDPGRRCNDGGQGQYRHSSIEAPLPVTPNAIISSNLPGVIRGSFVVHHDGDEIVGQVISPAANKAFLLGTDRKSVV